MEFSLPKYQSNRTLPINFKGQDHNLFAAELTRSFDVVNLISETNAWVYPEQILLKNGKPIDSVHTRIQYRASLNWRIKNLRKKKLMLEKGIWLTDAWSNNYFHWFTEVLPRILVLEKEFQGVPLLIPKFFQDIAFVSQSLEAFNISIHWIPVYQKVLVKHLMYLPPMAPSGNYRDEIMFELSQKIRKHFDLDKINPEKKIIISRQNAPSRKILNYKDLIPHFETFNIEEVTFENLSWKEQIKTVASAKVLIGVHGAGLTNMLFGDSGMKVLELRRKDDALNNCYFALSSALKMDYFYQLCEVDDPSKVTQLNNFKVDVQSLEKTLQEITV